MYSPSKPLPKDKLEEFKNKVLALSKEMFGENGDGHSFVQIILVDKTRYRDMYYAPLPLTKTAAALDKNGETKAELLHAALEVAAFNVKSSADDFTEFSERLKFKVEDSL